MDGWHIAPASQTYGDLCNASATATATTSTSFSASSTTESNTGGFGLADFLDGSGFLELGDPLLDGMPQIEGSESGSESGCGCEGHPKEHNKTEEAQQTREPQEEQAEPVYFGRGALEEMLRAVAELEQQGFVAGARVQDRLGQPYVLNRVEVTVQPHTGDLALRVIVHDGHTLALFAAHPAEILLLPDQNQNQNQNQAEETRVLPENEAPTPAPAEEEAAALKRSLDEDPGVLDAEPSPKRRLSSPLPSEAC